MHGLAEIESELNRCTERAEAVRLISLATMTAATGPIGQVAEDLIAALTDVRAAVARLRQTSRP